jgi:adenine deaminase
MKWNTRSLTQAIEAAQGKRPVDLCIRNCQLVNVLSGRIDTVNLGILDGRIMGWGDYEAENVIDAGGMYAAPGFIDGHLHIESTMLSPAQFAAAVLRWGTTAVVADPHEIANVLGLEGIRYFLDSAALLPLDIFINLPSCVPASPLETSGAVLRGSDLLSIYPHERVVGLAEMMNFPGVTMAIPDVLDKILLFQGGVLDGHCPQLTGLGLNAYLVGGIGSDHECTTLPEALEKLAKGMHIMIREGSQSKDLAALLPLIDDQTWPQCMLVSDDRHADDLLRDGHMNVIVNKAMALGLEPVRAITLASWTAACYFGLRGMGALAPGYQADLTLSPTLNPWVPNRVFKRGRELARDGRLVCDRFPEIAPPPSPMRISRVTAEDLVVPAQPGRMRLIGVHEGTLLTEKILVEPKAENGRVVIDTEWDVLKLVIFNRYDPGAKPSVAFVQGFGLKKGAIASTVAHDSHNLIAVGTSDQAIVKVVEAVRAGGGGMAIGAEDDSVVLLPLPIGGLMSDRPLEEVVARIDGLRQRAMAYGCALHNPFMALSFLALPVIPELKLSDRGLVDVSLFSFVPLFE